MEENINFIPLLLVLSLAFIVPLLLGRIRWFPIVVGEILAGIIIGHSGLGLVQETTTLEIFSTIGLSFLMFLAGLEIDFDRILQNRSNDSGKKNQPNLIIYALITYGMTLLLAIPSGLLINRLGLSANPWLLCFILSATSLGVLLPILKQRNLIPTLPG